MITKRALLGVAAAAALAVGLSACAGDADATTPGDVDAATATSAEDFGGMEGLIAAAQAEGELNVIALLEDWANYGAIMTAFEGEVRHHDQLRRPGRVERPSGCGKTTALRALAGLESVDAGVVAIDGEDVSALPTDKRDIGMVFQAYSLFPHMTVLENVEYGLVMRKVEKTERRRRAQEALELVGPGDHGARFAHQLSGGQQQRVALARALVTRPRVLLLEEPLSALDAKVRVQLREQIRRIQTELGVTTLFVTHDQEEALAVADRVAVMRAGRIEQIGTPEELYVTPATPFVADFVGLSNRLPGVLENGTITAAGATFALLGERQPDGPVLAYVRPEDVVLSTAGDATGLPATVVASSFLGSLRRTTVRLDDDVLLSVQHEVSVQPRPGDPMRVTFRGNPVSATATG